MMKLLKSIELAQLMNCENMLQQQIAVDQERERERDGAHHWIVIRQRVDKHLAEERHVVVVEINKYIS